MHGPGLFLMILRKGLGLFFERAIPKSAKHPNAQTSQKNSDFHQAWDPSHPESIPKASRKHPEGIGTKKATQQGVARNL